MNLQQLLNLNSDDNWIFSFDFPSVTYSVCNLQSIPKCIEWNSLSSINEIFHQFVQKSENVRKEAHKICVFFGLHMFHCWYYYYYYYFFHFQLSYRLPFVSNVLTNVTHCLLNQIDVSFNCYFSVNGLLLQPQCNWIEPNGSIIINK